MTLKKGTFLAPFWAKPANYYRGRDPMGVQNSSAVVYSRLLSGMTNVTSRIRYYGFFCWVFREYRALGLQENTNPEVQKVFIRRCELLLSYIHTIVAPELTGAIGSTYTGNKTKEEPAYPLADGARLYVKDGHTDVYFQNSWGGLGLVYSGSLQFLGLVSKAEGPVFLRRAGAALPPGERRLQFHRPGRCLDTDGYPGQPEQPYPSGRQVLLPGGNRQEAGCFSSEDHVAAGRGRSIAVHRFRKPHPVQYVRELYSTHPSKSNRKRHQIEEQLERGNLDPHIIIEYFNEIITGQASKEEMQRFRKNVASEEETVKVAEKHFPTLSREELQELALLNSSRREEYLNTHHSLKLWEAVYQGILAYRRRLEEEEVEAEESGIMQLNPGLRNMERWVKICLFNLNQLLPIEKRPDLEEEFKLYQKKQENLSQFKIEFALASLQKVEEEYLSLEEESPIKSNGIYRVRSLGFCYINDMIPRGKVNPKVLKLSRPGFSYDAIQGDFIQDNWYEIKSGRLLGRGSEKRHIIRNTKGRLTIISYTAKTLKSCHSFKSTKTKPSWSKPAGSQKKRSCNPDWT